MLPVNGDLIFLKIWGYFRVLRFTRQLVDLTRSLVKLSVDYAISSDD